MQRIGFIIYLLRSHGLRTKVSGGGRSRRGNSKYNILQRLTLMRTRITNACGLFLNHYDLNKIIEIN
ncbi:protein of unknown function [Legionella pneumophila subsp. pneumophila]|nr:protein of unknown function [Legionella pneumophila subsp. pneumophila]